jgi:nucleoside-diphosphate-sugar epimerase
MSNILVTGGAGMIGSNLVKKLVELNHQVIVIDNLWRGKLAYLIDPHSNKPFIDLDTNFFNLDLSKEITDIEPFKKVDYIIHLADVVAGIDYVFNNQSNLFRQNILINSNAIELAKRIKVKGFIYAGTACSFPAHLQNSFDYKLLKEEDLYPANPESAYGWSKLMGIYETELLEKDFGIRGLTLMFHNVYGAPCDYSASRSQVIPALIRKAIRYPQEDFIVWGSGKQGRAFIHIDDIVNALILGLEKGLGKGYIQIGPDTSTTIAEIASHIVRISEKNISVVFDVTKPEGDKARAADSSKALQLLGWKPTISLEEGLVKTYRWVENQIRRDETKA